MRFYQTAVIALGISLIAQEKVSAENIWLFENVKINDVALVSLNGETALKIYLDSSVGVIDYDCAATQQAKIVSYRAQTIAPLMELFLSSALAAQAQGKQVDIMVDTAVCDASAAWKNKDATDGLGYALSGIRVNNSE